MTYSADIAATYESLLSDFHDRSDIIVTRVVKSPNTCRALVDYTTNNHEYAINISDEQLEEFRKRTGFRSSPTYMSYAVETCYGKPITNSKENEMSYFNDFAVTATANVSVNNVAGSNAKLTRANAEALALHAAELLAKVDAREHMYGTDDCYKNGNGFYADIKYDNSETIYTYYFLKANNFWYSTGHTSTAFKRGTFDELVEWLETRKGVIVSMGLLKMGKAFVRNGEVL